MTPPLSNANCPKEFQKNPLPFDECAPANPDWREPKFRYPQFSVPLEYNYLLGGRGETGSFAGVGLIYRPHYYFGIGSQFSTNFDNQVQFLGRVQTQFNLHRHGLARGSVAALVGLNHFFGQDRYTEDWRRLPLEGTAFTAGGEMSMDFRVFTWMSLSPVIRMLYQPATELALTPDPSQKIMAKDSLDLSLGIRLSFDFFEKGE